LDKVQEPILWYVMLPAGLIGAAVIVFEKLQSPADVSAIFPSESEPG
jgi:hypothetical protein